MCCARPGNYTDITDSWPKGTDKRKVPFADPLAEMEKLSGKKFFLHKKLKCSCYPLSKERVTVIFCGNPGRNSRQMKKRLIWCGLILAMTLTAGCGTTKRQDMGAVQAGEAKKEEGEESSVPEEPVLSERETGNGQRQGVSVRIYHSGEEGELLCVNTVRTEEVTPEILLWNLASYGMLPDTVTAESLRQKEEEGSVLLELELSENFGEWFSAQDDVRKELTAGSLANTFLDAFHGEKIRITVRGKSLDGGSYEGYLGYAMYQEASYTLEEALYEAKGIRIAYFQLRDMENKEIEEQWNKKIQKHVERAADSIEEGGSYEESYTVKTMNDEILSVLMEGTRYEAGAPYPVRFLYTYNIDMESGSGIRLAHYRDVEKIAEDLMDGVHFRIDGELDGEFQQRMGILYGDAQQLADSLKGYDYEEGNENESPPGYSYQENGLTHLCMEVPHALGDYVDIVLDESEIAHN